ncbi:TetR family transcriptional regulator [Acinetobacter sp. ANC 4169]|uniref:TetR/AcrR family transcriptional regulator n=1 Tax=Acinetobacter sp. ANC 4169 TaxID=1977879 RepID=UPI000A3336A5|nr:TetR/AcrR family transcriptional regulator [Acinetobacter sp. ANC 4169]OTG73770.1 TetR family transcriptional regulator [Acinetobacter sp. ANC 4169]
MRPQKLSREQILNISALQFKRYGYAATSMEILAKACGLSKASFYYYYPSKEALLMDVLELTRQYLNTHLFRHCLEDGVCISQQFEQMHERAIRFFSDEVKGCLIGIISIEARYQSAEILEKIRAIFQDWEMAFYQLFKMQLAEQEAKILAKQSLADYEGAILMYRLNDELFYLDQVKQRILKQLVKKSEYLDKNQNPLVEG